MSKTFAMIAAIAIILISQAKGDNSPRKLGFDVNIDATFNIKTFSFLGQKIAYKYRVAVRNGKAINEIIIIT